MCGFGESQERCNPKDGWLLFREDGTRIGDVNEKIDSGYSCIQDRLGFSWRYWCSKIGLGPPFTLDRPASAAHFEGRISSSACDWTS